MRAVVLRAAGAAPELLDVTLAEPGPGEVRVRIVAAGVCHSDLHVLRGEWPLPMPLVMGHEGSGIVEQVGPGVSQLAVGDPVVLSWVAPCGTCRHCRAGREARCEVAATVVGPGGVLMDGTPRLSLHGTRVHHYLGVSSFAEAAVVPASGAIRIRDDAPLELCALVGCAIATGVGAVRHTAGVEPGSTVAVIGCGGVGLSVVQGARLAGAERIVAIDVLAAKTDVALQVGATDALVVTPTTAAEALRDLLPEGVDYAFDAIGHTSTTEDAIAMLGLGGAAVIVGLPPAGATASFEPLTLAESDQRILGSNYGSVRPAVDIPALVDAVMAGQIDLAAMVSGRRGLGEAGQALEDLAAGRALRTLLIP